MLKRNKGMLCSVILLLVLLYGCARIEPRVYEEVNPDMIDPLLDEATPERIPN
jgi:hypothetical protein